jgi:AcrR family transcriptional regulator
MRTPPLSSSSKLARRSHAGPSATSSGYSSAAFGPLRSMYSGLRRYRTTAYGRSVLISSDICLLYYRRLAKARMSGVTTREYKQRRRAEAAEETRRRILDAVYEQLHAAPAEQISIDRVAQAAEVARSTVYVAFGSRVGLLDALGEDLLQRAGFGRMWRQSRQPDARESLRAGIHELAAMYAAERDVIRALVSIVRLEKDAFSGAIARLEERRARAMTDLANRLADQDQLRPGLDPEDAANALWLLTSFDAFDLLHTGRLLPIQRVAETLTALAEHAVCRDA